jgi:hypothetical protein
MPLQRDDSAPLPTPRGVSRGNMTQLKCAHTLTRNSQERSLLAALTPLQRACLFPKNYYY